MNIDSPSELYSVAIVIWHFQRMELKDAVQAAEAMKAEQMRRVERFSEELQKIVGERDDISFGINGGCVEAEVDGLRFVALEFPTNKKGEYLSLVTLLGRCPSCGVETRSEPVHHLSGLGKMLEKFEPIQWHYCYRHSDWAK